MVTVLVVYSLISRGKKNDWDQENKISYGWLVVTVLVGYSLISRGMKNGWDQEKEIPVSKVDMQACYCGRKQQLQESS